MTAKKRKSASKKDSSENETKKTKSILNPEIMELAKRLCQLHQQARELGMFVEDRDTIECPHCHLMEDVTAEDLLVTYQGNGNDRNDSGMRFQEIDETHFKCPQCGATVELEPKEIQW